MNRKHQDLYCALSAARQSCLWQNPTWRWLAAHQGSHGSRSLEQRLPVTGLYQSTLICGWDIVSSLRWTSISSELIRVNQAIGGRQMYASSPMRICQLSPFASSVLRCLKAPTVKITKEVRDELLVGDCISFVVALMGGPSIAIAHALHSPKLSPPQ